VLRVVSAPAVHVRFPRRSGNCSLSETMLVGLFWTFLMSYNFAVVWTNRTLSSLCCSTRDPQICLGPSVQRLLGSTIPLSISVEIAHWISRHLRGRMAHTSQARIFRAPSHCADLDSSSIRARIRPYLRRFSISGRRSIYPFRYARLMQSVGKHTRVQFCSHCSKVKLVE
jgi:hypothetical protein